MTKNKNVISERFNEKNIIVCQEDPLQSLRVVTEETIDDNKKFRKVFHFTNDVSILFNQARIDRVDSMTLDKIISNLKSQKDSRYQNISDDDIIKTIKSRYFQSTTDLKTYAKYLESEFDNIVRDAKYRAECREYSKKYKKSDKQDKLDDKT